MNIVFREKGFKSRDIGLDKGAPELVYSGSNFALSVDLLGHCSPRDDKCHTYDENIGSKSSHDILHDYFNWPASLCADNASFAKGITCQVDDQDANDRIGSSPVAQQLIIWAITYGQKPSLAWDKVSGVWRTTGLHSFLPGYQWTKPSLEVTDSTNWKW